MRSLIVFLLFTAVSAYPFSGRVRSAEGVVMMQREGGHWAELSIDDAVVSGDSIRTSDGICTVSSPDGQIIVGSNTVVSIEKKGDRLNVLAGMVLANTRMQWSAIMPAAEVRFKNARIMMRVQFGVSRVAADDTSAGQIEVSAPGKNNEAMLLKPGMTVYGKADGSISAEVAVTAEYNALFRYARERESVRAIVTKTNEVIRVVKGATGISLDEPEESEIISGHAVNCRGYTIPGTTVEINGFLLSVASNGAFGPASIYLPRDGKNQLSVSITGTQGRTNFVRTIYAEHFPPTIRDIHFSGLRDGAALTPELRVQVKAAGTERVHANGFPLRRTGDTSFEGSIVSFKSGALPLVVEAISPGGAASRSERTVIFDIDTPFLIVREPIRLPLLAGVASRSARITVRINDTVVVDRKAAGGSFSFDLSKALAPYRGHNVKISVSCEDVYGRAGTSYAVTRYFDL
ncbi:MAG: hypothetical protein AABZ39_03190 [Spirochaetota bacterium]